MIGTRISHYQIIEKLGEGGMGVVYKAQDTSLDRLVALKFLPNEFSASGTDGSRFFQEARAAASLNHPNICTIHGIEEIDGRKFIVMEFVDGQTLQEKKSSLSLKQSIDVGIQIAEGLAAAHEKGIVHRDIKPENIMLRKDGRVQIMDFGLARLAGASRLTKEGTTVGTAGYMSPEQIQGMETDHRSDIFSLGVILFEMFSGTPPFKGVHETAIAYEVVNVESLPPSSVRAEIPPDLDAIVLGCLEKDPNERSQSAKQIALDLNRFKRSSSKARLSRAMPARSAAAQPVAGVADNSRMHGSMARAGWPIVSGILLLVCAVLIWSPWRESGGSGLPVMRFPIDLPLTSPLLIGASTVAISPDGRHLVFLALDHGVQKLFLRPLDQFESKPIAGTEGASDPFFSPDGQWVGFWTNGKLKKASVFGGAPQEICDISYMRGGWWGPDNTIYYGHINSCVYRVSANGGTPVAVTTLDTANGEISHRFPQVLPDGKTIIFTSKQNTISSFDEAVIAAENPDSHARKVLIHGGSYARYLPSGHLMFARGSAIYAVPFDAKKVEVTGPPIMVVEGGMLNYMSGDANYCFADNGVLVYVPTGGSIATEVALYWMDRQGNTQPLTNAPRAIDEVSLSRDGQKLAMTLRGANDDIWTYQIGRGTLARLTFGGGNNNRPQWTPDGEHIVFVSERRQAIRLIEKAWDGSGTERPLGNEINVDIATTPSFSPDGKMMIYGHAGDIWCMTYDHDMTSRPLIQSPSFESASCFSPNGRWISYLSNESGRSELYVVPFSRQEGKWQVSTNGAAWGMWSHDGKEIFYHDGKSMMKVDVKSETAFDFSSPKKVCDLPSSTFNVYDISPDGKRFVVGLTQQSKVSVSQVDVVVGWFDELKRKFSQINK
ncbi:MAG TPA: protein kinase [Bacteroidota bacterium]|nr:protein kinase [Bacteroidota bacterium]